MTDHRTPRQRRTDRLVNVLCVLAVFGIGWQLAAVFFEAVR